MTEKELENIENEENEKVHLEEYCDESKCEPAEEDQKLWMLFNNEGSYHNNHMLRRIQEEIEVTSNYRLFIFFDMGSINLDIDNHLNHIHVYEDYVEIYNEENGEFTFLKTDEIKGFVFEPKTAELFLEEVDDDSDD